MAANVYWALRACWALCTNLSTLCNPVSCSPFTKAAHTAIDNNAIQTTNDCLQNPYSYFPDSVPPSVLPSKPLPLLASGAALGSRLQLVARVGDALTQLGFDQAPCKTLPSLKECSECSPKQLENWCSSSFSHSLHGVLDTLRNSLFSVFTQKSELLTIF